MTFMTSVAENIPHLQVRLVPIDDLAPYARNSRRHAPEQVEAIANSIREFGWTVPCLIDGKNGLIAGHGRILAARTLGIRQIPCIDLSHLSETQKRAYVIADNQLPMHAGASWDMDLLRLEVSELKLEGFDVSLLGFGDELIDLVDPDIAEGEDKDPDDAPPAPEVPHSKPGDVWVLGPHKVICGSSTDPETWAALMGDERADICWTDPPYNVAYESKLAGSIKNDDMDDGQFRQFLLDAYRGMYGVMKPGAAIYVAHADTEGLNFRSAFREAGFKLSGCLIWRKDSLVLGRSDFQWMHEPCQPPGTMVRTPDGEVPIEKLRDGDLVVSYDPYSGVMKGFKFGRAVTVAQRHYTGNLYGVRVAGRQTWATDGHRFTVKYSSAADPTWCVYLMRRGDRWRVGVTRTYDARGFGLKHRFKTEGAEEAWIINSYKSRLDAFCDEQIISVKYGIPQTHWVVDRGYGGEKNVRTTEHIERIYASFDLQEMTRNAERLLADYGRSIRFPFLTLDNISHKSSTRVTSSVVACNLIPGIMCVPIPRQSYEGHKTFDWEPIEGVDVRPYDGPVHSLDVERDHHYVADGIVTHNCLYGWKPGSKHRWYGGRKQTTVMEWGSADPVRQRDDGKWEITVGDRVLLVDGEAKIEELVPSVIYEPKPKRSAEHPTMKPVALIERMLKNNARAGDLVIDAFGGSGSTLMAAERLGMSARLVELDPKFVDVIVRRWQNYAGRRAVHAATGEQFPADPVAAES